MARRREIRGSVVVITGASSGVGRATAIAFSTHETKIVLAARAAEPLQAAAADCEQRGAETLVVPTDIADAGAVEHLARRAVERFGRIDIWVEAAGVLIAAPFGSETPEEAARLVTTNVLGTYLGARAALSVFENQGSGVLIDVGSLLSLVVNPVVPAYVMSKFAVRGLSLSLRQAVSRRRDIHVCLVLPGPIDTPLFQRAANRTGRQLRAIPPAYAPERVAAAIIACARRPRRQVTVGVISRQILLLHRVAPRLVEWAVAQFAGCTITRSTPAPSSPGALFEPRTSASVNGGWRLGRFRRRIGERFGSLLAERGA